MVWRINGQSVNNLHGVTTASERGVHILTIRNARRKYNRSEIQCKAVFDEDGRVPEFTSPAILLLQGIDNSSRQACAFSVVDKMSHLVIICIYHLPQNSIEFIGCIQGW